MAGADPPWGRWAGPGIAPLPRFFETLLPQQGTPQDAKGERGSGSCAMLGRYVCVVHTSVSSYSGESMG